MKQFLLVTDRTKLPCLEPIFNVEITNFPKNVHKAKFSNIGYQKKSMKWYFRRGVYNAVFLRNRGLRLRPFQGTE